MIKLEDKKKTITHFADVEKFSGIETFLLASQMDSTKVKSE